MIYALVLLLVADAKRRRPSADEWHKHVKVLHHNHVSGNIEFWATGPFTANPTTTCKLSGASAEPGHEFVMPGVGIGRENLRAAPFLITKMDQTSFRCDYDYSTNPPMWTGGHIYLCNTGDYTILTPELENKPGYATQNRNWPVMWGFEGEVADMQLTPDGGSRVNKGCYTCKCSGHKATPFVPSFTCTPKAKCDHQYSAAAEATPGPPISELVTQRDALKKTNDDLKAQIESQQRVATNLQAQYDAVYAFVKSNEPAWSWKAVCNLCGVVCGDHSCAGTQHLVLNRRLDRRREDDDDDEGGSSGNSDQQRKILAEEIQLYETQNPLLIAERDLLINANKQQQQNIAYLATHGILKTSCPGSHRWAWQCRNQLKYNGGTSAWEDKR